MAEVCALLSAILVRNIIPMTINPENQAYFGIPFRSFSSRSTTISSRFEDDNVSTTAFYRSVTVQILCERAEYNSLSPSLSLSLSPVSCLSHRLPILTVRQRRRRRAGAPAPAMTSLNHRNYRTAHAPITARRGNSQRDNGSSVGSVHVTAAGRQSVSQSLLFTDPGDMPALCRASSNVHGEAPVFHTELQNRGEVPSRAGRPWEPRNPIVCAPLRYTGQGLHRMADI